MAIPLLVVIPGLIGLGANAEQLRKQHKTKRIAREAMVRPAMRSPPPDSICLPARVNPWVWMRVDGNDCACCCWSCRSCWPLRTMFHSSLMTGLENVS